MPRIVNGDAYGVCAHCGELLIADGKRGSKLVSGRWYCRLCVRILQKALLETDEEANTNEPTI